MTNGEFKAWFEGFSESIEASPTKKQWERIKARIAEIDGKPVTERIYVDRYLPTLYPYYYHCPNYPFVNSGFGVSNMASSALGQNLGVITQTIVSFDSSDAMHALGRVEAQ